MLFNFDLLKKAKDYAKKQKSIKKADTQELYLFCIYDCTNHLYYASTAFYSFNHARTFYKESMKDVDFYNSKLVLQGSFNPLTGHIKQNQTLVYLDFNNEVIENAN